MKSLFFRYVLYFLVCIFISGVKCDIFDDMSKFMAQYFPLESFFGAYKPKVPEIQTDVRKDNCVMTLDLEGLDPKDDNVHVYVRPSLFKDEPSYVTVSYTQTKHMKGEEAKNFHSQFDGFLAPVRLPTESQENVTLTVTSEAARSFPLPLECDATSPRNSKFAVEDENKLVVKFPKVSSFNSNTDTAEDTHKDVPQNLPSPKESLETEQQIGAHIDAKSPDDQALFEIQRARLEEF